MAERVIDPRDPALEWAGALDLVEAPDGVIARRLPNWTAAQYPDLAFDVVSQMPSGVRIRLATDSTSLELEVMLTLIQLAGRELRPAVVDLKSDGRLVAQRQTTTGTLITITGPRPQDVEVAVGGPTTIRFDGLEGTMKVLEVWLPVASVVEVRALRVTGAAKVEPAPPEAGRRWLHYGSSISHCMEAASPTSTWPAVAARLGGVSLTNLGLAGQCLLDPFVARAIRDARCDLISLKLGINVANRDAFRARTFGPAVEGFIDVVREGHPTTPVLVVSPIFCSVVEDHPGPTQAGSDGRTRTLEFSGPGGEARLTLRDIRAHLEAVVERRRRVGDANLFFLDGLTLFSVDDAGDLPDDLHPNAAGYVRIGERFAAAAFGPGGCFAE